MIAKQGLEVWSKTGPGVKPPTPEVELSPPAQSQWCPCTHLALLASSSFLAWCMCTGSADDYVAQEDHVLRLVQNHLFRLQKESGKIARIPLSLFFFFKSSEVFFPSMQLIQCSYNQLFLHSVTLVTLLALMCLPQKHPITACLAPSSINSSTLLSCAGWWHRAQRDSNYRFMAPMMQHWFNRNPSPGG